jgi:hypothetical protein
LYLGAVGALSNVFSLVCSARLSTSLSQSSNVVIVCQAALPLASFPLLLTTLSCTYWLTQVTLQLRPLADRLDHATQPHWHRAALRMLVGSVGIHFFCKASAQWWFQGAELQADPHLYAVVGGVFMSGLFVLLFVSINFRSNEWKYLRSILLTGWRRVIPSPRHQRDTTVSNISFLVKRRANQAETLYHYCATPYLAYQLQQFHQRQRSRPSTNTLDAVTLAEPVTTSATRSTTAIHEFVLIHCVAGAARHLETVTWENRSGTNSAMLTRVRAQKQPLQST